MMKVSEVMNREVVTIRSAATIAEAVQRMRQRSLFALIVDRAYEEDAYGIVTAADIVSKVTAFGRDPRRVRVYEIMTKPCIVLNPNLRIEYAARLFAHTGIHCAPVIQSELLGIVTMMDILTRGDFVEHPQEVVLAETIEQLTQTAHEVCQRYGQTSQDCANAWADVEALQAEAAYQQTQPIEKTALEAFREAYPEAIGAAEYDAWCSG